MSGHNISITANIGGGVPQRGTPGTLCPYTGTSSGFCGKGKMKRVFGTGRYEFCEHHLVCVDCNRRTTIRKPNIEIYGRIICGKCAGKAEDSSHSTASTTSTTTESATTGGVAKAKSRVNPVRTYKGSSVTTSGNPIRNSLSETFSHANIDDAVGTDDYEADYEYETDYEDDEDQTVTASSDTSYDTSPDTNSDTSPTPEANNETLDAINQAIMNFNKKNLAKERAAFEEKLQKQKEEYEKKLKKRRKEYDIKHKDRISDIREEHNHINDYRKDALDMSTQIVMTSDLRTFMKFHDLVANFMKENIS